MPDDLAQMYHSMTPKGKRRWALVEMRSGNGQIRWYVGGKIYKRFTPTPAHRKLSKQWIEANEHAD